MTTRRVLKAIEDFLEAWMKLKHHVTTALQGHIDSDKESSQNSPCNLTGRGRPLMWPIVEFVGRDCLQDAPGQVVFNFETRLVEFQEAGSGAIRHCFSPEPARSARVCDSPYIL
jgi:hypothetical protein